MRWVLRRGFAADGLDFDVDPAAFAIFAAFSLMLSGIVAAHGAGLAFLFGQGCGIDAVIFAHLIAMADRRAIVSGRAVPWGVALGRVGARRFYA
ncbi:hypothetical protein DSM104635_02366 [Terricaulis silvestris]|uniref:Uncharacterized protein n=1 Tax=Terricaulis silvestris TaxID=2686094 RepID=A0A6I6MRT5_9CAUL|nr:hypothetical protein DSM104635_02366 [Terricaulis silvestris]